MNKLVGVVKLLWLVFAIRWGWYTYRRELGYPISLWRAFTSSMPRFGSFEEYEAGCPKWNREEYNSVKENKG
jgi:hypothetical protein